MKLLTTLLFLILNVNVLVAQISPPGLGKAKTASWFAAGIRKNLNEKWQSMSYIGMGRKGDRETLNPLKNLSIWVLNQEFYHSLRKNGQYSFAVSFRNQKELAKNNEMVNQQELRLYGRLSWIYKTSKIKFVPTFREEIRKFFFPANLDETEKLQLRSRLRLQLSFYLNPEQNKKILVSSEQLFSTGENYITKHFSEFGYKESRFMVYYSASPKKLPFSFNIGYMNNLIGNHNLYDVSYLALDIIFDRSKKQEKDLASLSKY